MNTTGVYEGPKSPCLKFNGKMPQVDKQKHATRCFPWLLLYSAALSVTAIAIGSILLYADNDPFMARLRAVTAQVGLTSSSIMARLRTVMAQVGLTSSSMSGSHR